MFEVFQREACLVGHDDSKIKIIEVRSLASWYQGQGMQQEVRLLSSYLDWMRSEANVRILPEGVGERIPAEAQWVRTIDLLEKIKEASVVLEVSEAVVFSQLMSYIDSQLP